MNTFAAKSVNTKRVRRAKKVELTRQRLLDAAIRVVGNSGYSGTTVRKITSDAGLAHGTFYNYFRSDQELFDQLLPHLGEQLFEHLDNRISAAAGFLDQQEIILIAFDEFIRDTPSFYRVMSEAEAFAPIAFRTYIAKMIDWFVRNIHRDDDARSLQALDRQKLEVLLLMVIASNHYLNMRFGEWMEDLPNMPSWAVETFARFIRAGMLAAADGTVLQPAPVSGGADSPTMQDGQERGAGAGQPYVKFTPRNAVSAETPPFSAQSMQLDCRVKGVSAGHARVEIDIDRRTLNSRGAVSGGTLSALAEVAAGLAISHGTSPKLTGETVNISSTIIHAATEGKLVADARVENAGRNVRFVTVRTTRDTLNGPVIASASIIMRVID